jgi:excisionase family DNA binding protein
MRAGDHRASEIINGYGRESSVMLRPFLTARQVAELFQINVETVYDLIARDGLPATKLGGSWRFDEAELRTWFRTRRSAKAQHRRRNPGAVEDQ